MIKPTIGRQVWFWRSGPADGTQPEAATVCYVHGDTLVNLLVINHEGWNRGELEVSLRQPEDSEWLTGPFCEWIPYQKAVASGGVAPTLHIAGHGSISNPAVIHSGSLVDCVICKNEALSAGAQNSGLTGDA